MSGISFVWPLVGGLMIGLSAALYLLLNGRVAGVSGIVASTFGWTGAGISPLGLGFTGGLLGGSAIAFAFIRHTTVTISSSPFLLISGGLLVGFGTRLGSGCTSGHGVCGLARLSSRSMVATALFMAVAVLVVSVIRPILGDLP